MQIYIPSLGRPNDQRTIKQIPADFLEHTHLVVQAHEYQQYKYWEPLVDVMVLPHEIKDIATTRDWIITNAKEDVCMLDDDLTFYKRIPSDPTKFMTPVEEYMQGMFIDMEKQLMTGTAHIGVSGREGANRVIANYVYTTRTMRVLGYNTAIIRQLGLRFEPGGFMCDFHMNLALLKRGFQTFNINYMVHNQPGSNTAGGCSTQRTFETQKQAAENLQRLHPKYVTVVQKQTKTSWNGEGRYDVRIQWLRAYRDGTRSRAEILDRRTRDDQVGQKQGDAQTLVS